MKKIKYDFYESFIDGSGEHKLTSEQLKKVLTKEQIEDLTDPGCFEIQKGNLRWWAEEAMNYRIGIQI